MFGVYLSYWHATAFALAATIVAASLQVSRRRYWIALVAYTVLVFGTASAATFPMVFGIGMANAFGPSSVSPVAYVAPLVVLAFLTIPAIWLYPFASARAVRQAALICFGLAFLLIGGYLIYGLFAGRSRAFNAGYYSTQYLLLLLLWLRVYDARSAITNA